MEEKRYQIPPDLTVGKYIGGWSFGELLLIGGTSIAAIVILSRYGLSGSAVSAVPVAIAVLCRRYDSGSGYTAPIHTLLVMLRWFAADMTGNMDMSLRRHLRLDEGTEVADEKEENA